MILSLNTWLTAAVLWHQGCLGYLWISKSALHQTVINWFRKDPLALEIEVQKKIQSDQSYLSQPIFLLLNTDVQRYKMNLVSCRLEGKETRSAKKEERREWMDGWVVSSWKGFTWMCGVARSPPESPGRRWWAASWVWHALDKISRWHGTLAFAFTVLMTD